MAARGGTRALLLAAAALLCLCCLAAGPAAAQPAPKVAAAKPASAAVAIEQAAAGQTAAAQQQALEQAQLAGAADEENPQASGSDQQAAGQEKQQTGGSDQQAPDQGGSADQQAAGQGGSADQLSQDQALAMADPTQQQLQDEMAASAAGAAEPDATQQQAEQPAVIAPAAVPNDPAAADQGVVVLVVYKQPGGATADQAIASANANNATMREFVRRLTGGLGAPAMPLDSITFVGAQAFDPSTLPGVTDAGCLGVAGAWVQANVRINTPNAYVAYQNISSALASGAATATEARWNSTMGQLGGKAGGPCLSQNFTNFRFTPASTPPPAPPAPPSPKLPNKPTTSQVTALPPPLPEEASPSPAGPFFPTDTPAGGDSNAGTGSSGGSDPYGGNGGSDTSGGSDSSGSSSSTSGGSVGNPAYGSSPTPVYTSPSVDIGQSPGAPGLSPALDGTGTDTGAGTGIGTGSPGLGSSPGLGGSPSVMSPAVGSPIPIPGTASPPASPLPVPTYNPVLAPPTAYTPPSVYVPSTPYLNGGSGAALPPGEDPFGVPPGSDAMTPTAAPAPAPLCTAEPACKLFVGGATCCKQKGAVASGSTLRLWLVCNRDVYLPETKCLTATNTASKVTFPAMDPLYADPLNTVNVTVLDRPNARAAEYSVGLPLAFYVPPISTSPGRLSVKLDFEERRMEESDGTCSLRLREPCEWDGKLYAAVVPVDVLPVLSVMSANDTTSAYAQVQTALNEARKQAEQAAAAYSGGGKQDATGGTDNGQLGTDTSGSVSTASIRSAGRSMLAAWGAGMGRRMDGILLLGRQLQADEKNSTDKASTKKQTADSKATDSKATTSKATDSKAPDSKAAGSDKKKTVDAKSTDGKQTGKASDKKETDSKKDDKKKTDSKKTDNKKQTPKKESGKVQSKEVTGSSGGLNVAPGGQAVGSDLPAPSVDAAALPPLTDVLNANYSSDVMLEDFSVSWLPLESGAGKPACQSADTADLPESFLLGDFQELKGAEQACSDSQLGSDLPSAADLAASAGQSPATSSARRRFTLL